MNSFVPLLFFGLLYVALKRALLLKITPVPDNTVGPSIYGDPSGTVISREATCIWSWMSSSEKKGAIRVVFHDKVWTCVHRLRVQNHGILEKKGVFLWFLQIWEMIWWKKYAITRLWCISYLENTCLGQARNQGGAGYKMSTFGVQRSTFRGFRTPQNSIPATGLA